MKYFTDKTGAYIGGFSGGAKPKKGAIEIDTPPEHAADRWDGSAWDKSARPVDPDTPIEAAIKALADELPAAKRAHVLGKLNSDKRAIDKLKGK